MEIKINKDYKLITDEHNYSLYKKTDKSKSPKHIKKSLEDNWKIIGHYISMEHLAHEMVEREIRLSDAKNFKEVLCVIKDLKASISKVK